MENKIRVYGKAQNRTALGIANAYMVMNPATTLEELNQAFPASLLSTHRADVFVDPKRADEFIAPGTGASTWELFFFDKPEELITFQNGQQAAMQMLWQKDDYGNIVEHAKQYGIEVADCKPKEGFKKGGYTLEYINGYVPSAPHKKSNKWLLWLLIAIAIAAIVVLIILLGGKA